MFSDNKVTVSSRIEGSHVHRWSTVCLAGTIEPGKYRPIGLVVCVGPVGTGPAWLERYIFTMT